MNLFGHVYKVNVYHAEILLGDFGEMVGDWPVASCYFVRWCHSIDTSILCNSQWQTTG